MDYKGDYFPEEETLDAEWTPQRIVKAVFKGILYFFVMLVYLFFCFRFYVSCEPSMVEETVLSEQARETYRADPKDFPMYGIDTTNINTNGTLLLRRIVYADKVNELEFGVRYVQDKLIEGGVKEPLRFVLRDSKGNEYTLVNRESFTRFTYVYERVCFSGVDINVLENKYFAPAESEESKVPSFDLTTSEDEFETELKKGTVYKVQVYYGDSLIQEFEFYNNLSPMSETVYK